MSDLTATQIFNEDLPAKLEKNADSVTKVNAVYQFNISGDNGGTWTVDLTKDSDFVSEGASDDADCTVTMKEDDFIAMWDGSLPGTQAFMTGKLKIAGDMGLAMKLQKII